jgi:hypothetical protein
MALLRTQRLAIAPRGLEAREHSVDEGAGLEQLCEGAEAGTAACVGLGVAL